MQQLIALASQDLSLKSVRSLLDLAQKTSCNNIASVVLRALLGGGVLLVLRRLIRWIRYRIARGELFRFLETAQKLTIIDMYPTAYIAASDASYLWIMAYLAQNPSCQAQIKNFQLSTAEARQVRQGAADGLRSHRHQAGKIGEHNASWTADEIIGQVLPTYSQFPHSLIGSLEMWIIC